MPYEMQRQNKRFSSSVKESNIVSKNSGIIKLLEVILEQQANSKELRTLVFKFCSVIQDYTFEDKVCNDFDALLLFVLDYAFEQNDLTLSVVSKAVYSHTKRNLLTLDLLIFRKDFFLEMVRDFTNFNSEEGKEILLFALIECLTAGNIRLSKVLIKFGLVDFPSSATEEGRKILENLMFSYTDCNYNRIFDHPPQALLLASKIDDILNRIEMNKEFSFRRCIFILTVICIVSEYESNEYNEMLRNYAQSLDVRPNMERYVKLRLNRKICLDLFITMSSETYITLTDIDKFFGTILNPQSNEAHRTSLLEKCREMFPEINDNYNPRTLKHLVRGKIRECLQHSEMLTKDVDELSLPLPLKDFLIFGEMRNVEGS